MNDRPHYDPRFDLSSLRFGLEDLDLAAAFISTMVMHTVISLPNIVAKTPEDRSTISALIRATCIIPGYKIQIIWTPEDGALYPSICHRGWPKIEA